MKSKHSFALTLAMSACTLSAQAAPAIDGAVSLYGLTYELIDLDPNDGITPSIQFKNSSYLLGATDDYYAGTNYQALGGSPFNTAVNGLVQSSDGSISASIANGKVMASFAVDGAALRNLGGAGVALNENEPTAVRVSVADVYNHFGTGTRAPDNAPEVADQALSSFTLSANTQLVVSGNFQFNLNANIDAIPGGLLRDGVQQGLYTARVLGAGGVDVYLVDTAGELQDRMSVGQIAGQVMTKDGIQPLDGADSTMDYGDSFSINFINATTASKEGGLWTSVVASNEVSLFAQPVPEPSTWTLMGLGLLGVVAAAKRRRQAA